MKEDKITGGSYPERAMSQLELWVKGISLHNTVDSPDFSCCNTAMNTPFEQRKTFAELIKADDPRAEQMLMGFLGELLAKMNVDKDVRIAGRHKTENN